MDWGRTLFGKVLDSLFGERFEEPKVKDVGDLTMTFQTTMGSAFQAMGSTAQEAAQAFQELSLSIGKVGEFTQISMYGIPVVHGATIEKDDREMKVRVRCNLCKEVLYEATAREIKTSLWIQTVPAWQEKVTAYIKWHHRESHPELIKYEEIVEGDEYTPFPKVRAVRFRTNERFKGDVYNAVTTTRPKTRIEAYDNSTSISSTV